MWSNQSRDADISPALPWDAWLICMLIIFHGGEKSLQKTSGSVEQAIPLPLEMVLATLKGLRDHSERATRKQQNFLFPRRTKNAQKNRILGSLAICSWRMFSPGSNSSFFLKQELSINYKLLFISNVLNQRAYLVVLQTSI